MKITNLRKAIAASLMASGLVCGSAAYAAEIDHVIGDPSFDDTPVAAGGYSYFNGLPDSAWESDGTWWYNTDYATNTSAKRPDPRTGDQAAHGYGSYNWQTLGDTFEAGRTYTLSTYAGGDSDATGPADGSDRIYLYLYDGTAKPASFDAESLVSASYERDGLLDVFNGEGTGTNAGWTIGGGNEWGLISVSYTATADVEGLPIGVAFYGRGDAALDDVSLTSIESVPEPSTVVLCGLGIAGLLVLKRRKLG
jgi:hypothetical protein